MTPSARTLDRAQDAAWTEAFITGHHSSKIKGYEQPTVPWNGLTVTDLFCGAGGSSSGLKEAGFKVVIAANHWALAIESHQTPPVARDLGHAVADFLLAVAA